ncbi:MAG: 7-carboxy-7-deazaguanine synthase QueE [Bacteroidetes bacterium HGW-Bacteroidetes-6]|jgi:organic radical activating enzyme|nr:MAG: 7-carboxy-7-deazaguanine synthase QueE [Bacteroidetes bacterium HGW-Bacteroidetes-6]
MKTKPGTGDGLMLPLMEQFLSLQGEGVNTGRAAWFIRLGGCDVGCSFCDVKESWNPDLHPLVPANEIVEAAAESKAGSVVITGGEPLMWNLDHLTSELKSKGIAIFVETSGSEAPSGTFDWICLSPKKGQIINDFWFSAAGELKIIIETESDFVFAENLAKRVNNRCILLLQPEWSVRDKILPLIIRYISKNPDWRLSVQTHKYIKIP